MLNVPKIKILGIQLLITLQSTATKEIFENACRTYIQVIHQPVGPYWEKTVPEVLDTQDILVLKTEGTVFPNTDRPKLVNNIFIFFLQHNERRANDQN